MEFLQTTEQCFPAINESKLAEISEYYLGDKTDWDSLNASLSFKYYLEFWKDIKHTPFEALTVSQKNLVYQVEFAIEEFMQEMELTLMDWFK